MEVSADVTKDEFLRYEVVRRGGVYNMIMDASQAMAVAKLTRDKYFDIIKNYDAYRRVYLANPEPGRNGLGVKLLQTDEERKTNVQTDIMQ